MVERLTLTAERLVAGGDALARDADGRIVFVNGALPGETVHAVVTRAKRDVAFADVEVVVEASPARRQPPCPQVDAGCGGCGWQHLVPEAQLAAKVSIVDESLRRIGRLPDAEVAAGATLASEGFRTSVRMAVDGAGRLGFRAARSHDVVPTERCLVTHPLLDALLPGLRLPGASEVSLRVGVCVGGAVGLVDRSADLSPEGLAADVAIGRGRDRPRGGRRAPVPGRRRRRSSSHLRKAPPHWWTRCAPPPATLATTAPRAIDAYAGVGLFAATVFSPDTQVVAVESSRSACADARVNVPAARVVQSVVEGWRAPRADLVVADPARAGLGKAGVASLLAARPERIVLVSCDPVSLAARRKAADRPRLPADASEVFDLFPNTPHVEVVTRFDRV